MSTLPRRGEYGIDGSVAGMVAMGIVAVAALLAAVALHSGFGRGAMVAAAVAAYFTAMLGFYLHATRRGKFIVWAEILGGLRLKGDERVLDAGCGRGAVLTMVGQQLPRGRAVGIDLWSKGDQFGNGIEAAERNLAAERVGGRCEVMTGDLRAIPFADASFDLVLSSLVIHNIRQRDGRSQAIAEIARVLRPGGRAVLADLAWTQAYAQQLEQLGFVEVSRRPLGWRFWWGPAFPTTSLVIGTKPRVSK